MNHIEFKVSTAHVEPYQLIRGPSRELPIGHGLAGLPLIVLRFTIRGFLTCGIKHRQSTSSDSPFNLLDSKAPPTQALNALLPSILMGFADFANSHPRA